MSSYRKGYRTVVVDVDVSLDEFEDVDLVGELQDRGYTVSAAPAKLADIKRRRSDIAAAVVPDVSPSVDESLQDVRRAIVEGRVQDAVAILDRILAPKFSDIAACQAAIETALAKGRMAA